MRKFSTFFTLAIAVFAAGVAIAQTDLEAIEPQTLVTGTTADALLTEGFDIRNNSSETINVKVRRFVIEEVPGTYNYFCWEQCYTPPVSVSPTSIPIGPGQTVSNFYADYQPMGIPGSSTFEYCFYDESNFSNQTCVTITFDVSVASSTAESERGSVGYAQPNPAFDLVRIPFSLNEIISNANLHLYNMVGQLVKSQNIATSEGFIEFNVSSLPSGLYMYGLMNKGEMISSGKLVVK